MPLVDRANLPVTLREELASAVERLSTLSLVIQWGLCLPEESVVSEVVIQDEFTHDVILRWRGELHLVFDTT
jgi:hypothetical protein